jgi:hypothetical protein
MKLSLDIRTVAVVGSSRVESISDIERNDCDQKKSESAGMQEQDVGVDRWLLVTVEEKLANFENTDHQVNSWDYLEQTHKVKKEVVNKRDETRGGLVGHFVHVKLDLN